MEVAEPDTVSDDPQNRLRLILHRCRFLTLRLLLLATIIAAVVLAFGLGSGDVAAEQGVRFGVAILLLSIVLWFSFWLEERHMKSVVIELLSQQKRLSEPELIELSKGVLERRSVRYVLAQMHREDIVACVRERRPGGESHRVFFRSVPARQSSTKVTRTTILADPS